jgi:hypothetical protein
MRKNNYVQQIYDLHTRRLSRDVKHLGDAESLDDVANTIEFVKPNVYMLAKCCTDGVPTLQLANWDIVRRMRIDAFSETDRQQMNQLFNERGIEYRETGYLALNPDFSEGLKCKIQTKLKFLYELYHWCSQNLPTEAEGSLRA